jgi:DNA-binding XRE family transcriptional regulator
MFTSLDDYLKQKLQEDPEFAKEYERLELPSMLARQVIKMRVDKGITQAELAQLVGTQQSSISRLESMTSLPSLTFLQRIAAVLDARIEINLTPNQLA